MKIDPVAFTLFGIDVKWYGVLIAMGALLAIFFAEKLAKKKGLYDDLVTDFSFFVIIFGIIGARLYYVLFEWEYYSLHKDEIFSIRNGGLAIYGGIIAGIIVAIVFSKIKKVEFWDIADIAAPGLALAQGIGRWGNFINGEAHGGVTNLPWAILVNGQRVHPTFLYESILDIGIFFFLYFYLSKNQKFKGQLFTTYMIIYGIGRFFIEGLRTDSLYIGIFRVSQLVSLLMVLVGVIVTIRNKKILKEKED